MLKVLIAALFVSFVTLMAGMNVAIAQEVSEGYQQQNTQQDAMSYQTEAADSSLVTDFARRGYSVQWRDVRTGQSISGWIPSDQPVCGHGSNCACGGENYCGQFRNGQRVKYWDQGCGQRPRTLVCDVR